MGFLIDWRLCLKALAGNVCGSDGGSQTRFFMWKTPGACHSRGSNMRERPGMCRAALTETGCLRRQDLTHRR